MSVLALSNLSWWTSDADIEAALTSTPSPPQILSVRIATDPLSGKSLGRAVIRLSSSNAAKQLHTYFSANPPTLPATNLRLSLLSTDPTASTNFLAEQPPPALPPKPIFPQPPFAQPPTFPPPPIPPPFAPPPFPAPPIFPPPQLFWMPQGPNAKPSQPPLDPTSRPPQFPNNNTSNNPKPITTTNNNNNNDNNNNNNNNTSSHSFLHHPSATDQQSREDNPPPSSSSHDRLPDRSQREDRISSPLNLRELDDRLRDRNRDRDRDHDRDRNREHDYSPTPSRTPSSLSPRDTRLRDRSRDRPRTPPRMGDPRRPNGLSREELDERHRWRTSRRDKGRLERRREYSYEQGVEFDGRELKIPQEVKERLLERKENNERRSRRRGSRGRSPSESPPPDYRREREIYGRERERERSRSPEWEQDRRAVKRRRHAEYTDILRSEERERERERWRGEGRGGLDEDVIDREGDLDQGGRRSRRRGGRNRRRNYGPNGGSPTPLEQVNGSRDEPRSSSKRSRTSRR